MLYIIHHTDACLHTAMYEAGVYSNIASCSWPDVHQDSYTLYKPLP